MSATTDPSYAQVAADIGLTSLRTLYPALTGSGVRVGQVEASGSGSTSATANDFEVDPGQIGHPADNSDGFLTYFNALASTATYKDGTIGTFSMHATVQASFCYGDALFDGAPTGVAPGVAHVDNYFANNFTTNLQLTPSFPDKVVNMSFFYDPPANDDTSYDAAANADNIVFVASAGNGGTPESPSSAYNVISVDSSISVEATGPAPDGVPKPDISAPQIETSRTAAIVSGCATLLVQAGTAGWAGATAQNEADAVDFRTVKALLLNGAVKPSDYYSNAYAPTASHPLSAVYGSGDVNILNSVQELYGGEFAAGATTSVPLGGTATIPAGIAAVTASEGWNLGSLTAGSDDAIDFYALDLGAGQGLIATLTWAANNSNAIDFLELDLVNKATGTTLASSAATASNVQQVRFNAAAATDTVLEVRLHGAATAGRTDSYALAFAPLDTVACFCAGARILSERGEVPVERLVPGDRVITAGGRAAPVRFVGHSRAQAASEPVRILADAFGEGLPHRDLLLSPEHAVAITDAEGLALVPVHRLINGATIAPVPAARPIDYYHVELDRHDVILAEGLPVESYLDTGNRHAFDNAGVVRALHPSFGPDAALRIWAERACAPLLLHGPRLGACHARLWARAEAAFACTPDPCLRAIPHGREIAPRRCGPGHARFLLPSGCGRVQLASRTSVPRHGDPEAVDGRRLGVPLTALRHAGREVELDTPLLSGMHALETDGALAWRWTDGAAEVGLVPVAGASWLEVWWIDGWARYWGSSIRSGALRARGDRT